MRAFRITACALLTLGMFCTKESGEAPKQNEVAEAAVVAKAKESDTLNRESALALLKASVVGPTTLEAQVILTYGRVRDTTQPAESHFSNELKNYFSSGALVAEYREVSPGIYQAAAVVAPAARQYVIKEGADMGFGAIAVTAKACEETIGEITGIPVTGGAVAQVEFTWVRVNHTPFAAGNNPNTPFAAANNPCIEKERDDVALFQKYDDGWRLVELEKTSNSRIKGKNSR